jgi:hypothetical protein
MSCSELVERSKVEIGVDEPGGNPAQLRGAHVRRPYRFELPPALPDFDDLRAAIKADSDAERRRHRPDCR